MNKKILSILMFLLLALTPWFVSANSIHETQDLLSTNLLSKLGQFSSNLLRKKRDLFQDTKDKEKSGFYGIGVKWKLDFPVRSFGIYGASITLGYPISVPFDIWESDEDKFSSRSGNEIDGGNPAGGYWGSKYGNGGLEQNNEVEMERQRKRYRRDLRDEKRMFYGVMEDMIDRLSLPPRDCLLRTICEVSEVPFDETLLGDTLNVMLSSSKGGMTEDPDEDPDYNAFLEAEQHGIDHGNCHHRYLECPLSVLDVIPGVSHSLM